MFTLLRYVTLEGRDMLGDWLAKLKDTRVRARIAARLARLRAGNFGDCKSVGGSISELRIDHGPGYRIYFSKVGTVVVLLLCAGDKQTQEKDIKRAKEYLDDFRSRTS